MMTFVALLFGGLVGGVIGVVLLGIYHDVCWVFSPRRSVSFGLRMSSLLNLVALALFVWVLLVRLGVVSWPWLTRLMEQ